MAGFMAGKGTWIALGVIGAILLIVIGGIASAVSAYNSLNAESKSVDAQSKQVDVQYQRAFGLLPQLTNITDRYMQNESDVQKQVAALRSGAAITSSAGSLNQKDNYTQQLSNLVLLVGSRAENYPDLVASHLYANLQTEVTNTYNKIAAEKVRYNERVQTYETHRTSCCIPLLVASSFGFGAKEYVGFSDRPDQSTFPAGQPL
jgi:LemA protein